jgi:hypothetical protein
MLSSVHPKPIIALKNRDLAVVYLYESIVFKINYNIYINCFSVSIYTIKLYPVIMERLKPGRKKLPPGEGKTKKYPISFIPNEFDKLLKISQDNHYRFFSDFIRDFITKGIQAKEEIKKLQDEIIRLKETHPYTAERDITLDIFWYLSENPVRWKEEDFQAVLPPEYDIKEIRKALGLIHDDELIGYMPGMGWQIENPFKESPIINDDSILSINK